ncbi:carbohydrate ABC transporter permease [Enterococcus asini]|uniref:carbohydrate ABC transporter permease n=1 Tax=Enterococcus asini TaxID=57732 RepID=UPI0026DAB177|nr:carbohydrate ABC transporter permease [Enterococcus asini]
MKKYKTGSFSRWIAFLFLLVMACIWIIPLGYGVLTSFKSEMELMTSGFKIMPIEWVLTNYQELLVNNTSTPLIRWFTNSLVISVSHTLLVLAVVSLSAFAYSRLNFKGKNALFSFLLATMMFPSVVNLIPLYKIVDILGWVNTPLAMIVPGASGVFNIFLVKQFMDNIPKDFDEAAQIDGASEGTIFVRIILPLIKPVLLVVALFAFTGSWNDFLWPSIVFNDIEKMPITSGLQLLQGMYQAKPTLLMAGALVAIIPTFILYLFAQKYFLQSMSLSAGVKG